MEFAKGQLNHFKSIIQEHSKLAYAAALIFLLVTLLLPLTFDNMKEMSSEDVHSLTLFFSSRAFVFVSLIGLASILVYAFIDKYLDSSDTRKTIKDLKDVTAIVNHMIASKGLNNIVNEAIVSAEESQSSEIIIITEDLLTDINKDYESVYGKNKMVGKFYDAVSNNMKAGKQYTYLIKLDSNTYNFISEHMKSHYDYLLKEGYTNIKEPKFVLIPALNYHFFSQIIIYQDRNKAYEWLPSIDTDDKIKMDDQNYYLELGTEQKKILERIVQNISHDYKYVKGSSLIRTGEQIVDDVTISTIEEKSTKITIITDDLSKDLDLNHFGKSVIENLKDKKDYDYILPNKPSIITQILEYKEKYKQYISKENQVEFYLISGDMFFFFSDIFIFEKIDKTMDTFEFIPVSQMYFRHQGDQEKKLLDNVNTLKHYPSTIIKDLYS